MKTRYRFIYFNEDAAWWICRTNKENERLGHCEYFHPWKRWQFEPCVGTAFTPDCLQDIAHFMGQLKKP